MKLDLIKLDKALNKAYFKQSLKRDDIDLFKKELIKLFNYFDEKQDEDYHKNIISDFLKEVYYKNRYIINVNKNEDLVIKTGNSISDRVGVILEFKKPNEKKDMISVDKPNAKALQQLIFYYLRERIDANNSSIKHLIATNFNELFIFDEVWFEKNVYRNTLLKKEYNNFKLSGQDTKFFYEQIAARFIDNLTEDIPCTYININNYKEVLYNSEQSDDSKLINFYKILSPEHLLKLPFANDYNKIDTGFYNELLHILGLEETKKGGKKIITRLKEKKRNEGSLLENVINILENRKKRVELNISKTKKYSDIDNFSIALELSITWLNRILFLKLLEAQLLKYHKGNKSFLFLSSKTINDFDELDELFFEVFAIPVEKRNKSVIDKFGNLPYLNSSLFEPTDFEQEYLFINSLKDRLTLPISKQTVLKDIAGNPLSGELNTLEYLFEFLNAYSFSNDHKAEIQTDSRTIINAAVLGLIFEKINGYKDGSFYTPSFITTYISRETIRNTVVERFRNSNLTGFGNLSGFEELKDRIDYANNDERKIANEIINNIKIIDPAAGSGHFLVSALNELIAVKSELKILSDTNGKRIRGIKIDNINDELEIIDEETSEPFQYVVNDKGNPPSEIQNIQKAIFYEKRNLIENCIYGVDINPKSVLICRLRLWIELLKNTFYTEQSNYFFLETLPNIDINIKTGNSLISKFDTGLDLFERTAIKNKIIEYKFITDQYKKTSDYNQKTKFRNQIENIKTELQKYAIPRDKHYRKYLKKKDELGGLLNIKGDNKTIQNKIIKLTEELTEQETKYKENYNKVYSNSMEWAVEFPEILTDEGVFEGFDIVMGNPPYFSISKDQNLKEVNENYTTYKQTGDIYTLFIERGMQILKKKGRLNYITSNKWLRASYGESLRSYLLKNSTIEKIIDFDGLKVFDEATVDTGIIEIQKHKNGNKAVKAVRFDKTFDLEKDSIYRYFEKYKIELTNLTKDSWNLKSEKENAIKNRIETAGKRLENWNANIYRGITTGLNEAFVINEETKNKLIEADKKNKDFIKPLLRGRDVKRYGTDFSNLWIICVFPTQNIDIKKHSSLRNYLNNFKEKLESKPKNYKGNWLGRKTGNFEWYEIQDNTAYYPEFEKEKIVFTKASQTKSFAYDNKGYYLLNTSYVLTGKNLKYLLAILNSKLTTFAFLNYYQSGGIEGEITVQAIKKLPIPEITQDNQETVNSIEVLVNQIIEQKENNSKADITAQTTEIDKLVYRLYKLTKEEIEMIEK